MNYIIYFFYIYSAAYGTVAKNHDDFSIHLTLKRPSQNALKLLIERKNKKCYTLQKAQRFALSSEVCSKIFDRTSLLADKKSFSNPATEHQAYFEITYKSGAKNWSKRILEFERQPSTNTSLREVISYILKEIESI